MTAVRHPAAVTRLRVHDAALELFLVHGYEGTSLRTIASHLGITKAAVYYYYRTKGDLVRALLAPVWAELTQLVDDLGSAPQAPRDEHLLEAYVDTLIRHRHLVLLVDRDPAIRSQPAVRSGLLALRQQVEAAILGDRPDEERQLRLTVLRAGVTEALLAFPGWDDERLRLALLGVGHALLGGRRRPARARKRPGASRPSADAAPPAPVAAAAGAPAVASPV